MTKLPPKHSLARALALPLMGRLAVAGWLALSGCDPANEPGKPLDAEVDSKQAAQRSGDMMSSTARALKATRKTQDRLGDLGRGADDAPVPKPAIRKAGSVFNLDLDANAAASFGMDEISRHMPRRLPVAMAKNLSHWAGLRVITRRPVATAFGAVGPDPMNLVYAKTEEPGIDQTLDDTGQKMAKALRERVLVAANIESKSDAEVMYLLRPDPTCRDLDSNEVDKSCAKELGKVQVRVRMTRQSTDGVQLDVLIGAERSNPVSLSISPSVLAADVHLDAVKTAAGIIARALDDEEPEMPAVMKGTVRFSLTKKSDRAVTFALALPDMVDIQNTGSTVAPSERIVVRIAKSDPLFAVGVDGDAGTMTAQAGVGQVEVIAPWIPANAKTPNGDLRVVVAGMTATYTATEAVDALDVKGYGLGGGPSFVEIRGMRVFQVDLNENNGRKFDANVSFSDKRSPRIAISPRLDVSVMMKLALVAAELKSKPDVASADELYRLTLDPEAGKTVAVQTVPGTPPKTPFDDAGPGGIRVLNGKLSLAAIKAGKSVTVISGQCLVSREAAPNDHPLLGSFASGPCP